MRRLELALGLFIWLAVLWDGFATVVLPRTVAPMSRLSSRFARLTWRIWSSTARRIPRSGLRLSVFAVFGPLSIMLLLVVWCGLIILAFALMYDGLGSRIRAVNGAVRFGTLLYMSASTFLTLGLGDVTTTDPLGRLFVVFEAGTGYLFLALIITYMPLIDDAYRTREVGSLLIHSRAGHPPSAIHLLSRYATADSFEILRGNLREAEQWTAETLHSHLCHPILAFYRAQHSGASWLVSLATVLDSSALLIVGGDGLLAAQAKLTYRVGVRLLDDLARALGLRVDPHRPGRLTHDDVPALAEAIAESRLAVAIGPEQVPELLRLVRRYDVRLVTLADWLVVTLPPWVARVRAAEAIGTTAGADDLDGRQGGGLPGRRDPALE